MLKENFLRNNRVKHGVPSDSAISPSVAAPTKSLHHGEDQRSVKSAKSLSYGEILPKPNPECHLLVHKNTLGELSTIWHDLLSTDVHLLWPVRNFVCLQWSQHLSQEILESELSLT